MHNVRPAATSMGWKSVALGSTALSVLLLAGNAAIAAGPAAPAAGSLPGAFSSNSAATYGLPTTTNPTAGLITITGGNTVLQWGGTALANKITAPSGITANPGFSIGSGAALAITGGASVLVSDLTGNPSQVFGALNASGVGGPLFVSNTNGVIVGAGGTITAPAAGVGLLGYAVDPTAFAGSGTVTVNNATAGAGTVTVASGATISGGPVLVASNGTVNFGAAPSAPVYALGGYGFTTAAGSVTPTATSALSSGGSSVVNFTPAAANGTITVTQLFTGGAANNSANLMLPTGAANMSVGGVLTNSGVITETSELTGTIPGGLVNNGVINETSAALFIFSAKGNVQNLGVLNVPASGLLSIEAANVDLEGTVQAGGKALSSTNALAGLSVVTSALPASQNGGVVDINTTLFSSGITVAAANVIRVLSSGAIFATVGDVNLDPGTKASAVSDPFYHIPALQYTMSVFAGGQVQATAAGSNITISPPPGGGTAFGNSPGVNLDGTLSAPTISITANNINGAGGLSVPNAGTINLVFYGNVNNPHGAANNGSTAFQYNYLPVAVGLNGTKTGTATISLAGPSSSSTTDQNVNILVNGNVSLADGAGAAVAPTLPTAVLSSYANNHLVVSATGNIGLSSAAGPTFYWPGFVYLASGITASNPTLSPNATASIALGDTSGVVNLTNLIPADLTKPDVSGQIGHGGVFYLTNNLNLSPATTPPPVPVATTTISNNSWVNFLTAAQAAAYSTATGGNFKGATITGSVVNTAALPAGDFQP